VIDVDDTVAQDASSKKHPADAYTTLICCSGVLCIILYVRGKNAPQRRVRVSPVHDGMIMTLLSSVCVCVCVCVCVTTVTTSYVYTFSYYIIYNKVYVCMCACARLCIFIKSRTTDCPLTSSDWYSNSVFVTTKLIINDSEACAEDVDVVFRTDFITFIHYTGRTKFLTTWSPQPECVVYNNNIL